MADSARTIDVLARLDALEAENARLAAEVRALRSTPAPTERDAALSRRALLRLAGAGVVGAGAAVAGGIVGATPAAADGPNVLLGNGGDGTGNDAGPAQTSIKGTVPGHTSVNFFNNDTGSNSSALQGFTSGGGVGVLGKSVSGHGVHGIAGAGSGSSVLPCGVVGDADQSSSAGVCGLNTGGGPGVQGITGADFSHSFITSAVMGQTSLVNQGGVFGVSDSGYGVVGFSNTGYGVRASGGHAQLWLDPALTAGPPTTGFHSEGELFVDQNCVQWFCVARGTGGTSTPPTFVRVITSGVNAVPSTGNGVQINQGGTGNAIVGNIANASSAAVGVYGITSGPGQGVKGYSSGHGIGVYGQINNTANGNPAVYGNTNGMGPGVEGNQTGTGYGVLGNIANTANSVAAVRGVTNGTGPALQGVGSASGRGGQFSGGAAQLNLVPASTTGKPTSSGQKGDLFLDSAGALFLCQGGTTWKTVQLV